MNRARDKQHPPALRHGKLGKVEGCGGWLLVEKLICFLAALEPIGLS
jgi:hypothetical protein